MRANENPPKKRESLLKYSVRLKERQLKPANTSIIALILGVFLFVATVSLHNRHRKRGEIVTVDVAVLQTVTVDVAVLQEICKALPESAGNDVRRILRCRDDQSDLVNRSGKAELTKK